MASEAPSETQTQVPTGSDSNSSPYWCYSCRKRVSIETLADLPDVICHECKGGFVESIGPPSPSGPEASDPMDDPTFGNQFLQVLRLIAQAARDEDAHPLPPSEHAANSEDDYLRIELDSWDDDNDDDDDDDEEEDREDDDNEIEVRNEDVNNPEREVDENRDPSEDDEEDDEEENDDVNEQNESREGRDEDDIGRRRHDVLRLRLRDFATRAANRRNRILDWAEILMGLEDHSIELRVAMPEGEGYIGNPGDYVDAAGYEALLQNLAENDSSGRRGAPPAAKAAVEALETMEIKSEGQALACAICKDTVGVGEMVMKLPCGHGYHGDCIVPWLGSRNSCPVCRFELPTDDPEYEEERKKRTASTSSSGGSGDGHGGFENELF